MHIGHDREGSNEQLSNENQSMIGTSDLPHSSRDPTNESDLHRQWFEAASMGNTQTIRRLLDMNVYVGVEDDKKSTALHVCAFHGYKEAVCLLLNEFAAVNTRNRDLNTALHYAAGNGHIKVVRLLIKNGAAVNAKNKYSDTALHRAAESGYKEVVKLLLDNDAIVDITNQGCDTALHRAAREGHEQVVSLLLKHDRAVRAENQDLYTALHQAACSGHIEVVRLLLQHGTLNHSTDENLHTTLLEATKRRHINVTELLLDTLTTDENDQQSKTVLRKAVLHGDCDVVGELLTSGSNVDEKSENGKTLLAELSEIGYTRMATVLLEHKADTEARDLDGQTPLVIAAKAAQLEMVDLLLNKESETEATGNDSLTALHWSAKEGHLSIVEKLLQNEANIEAVTKHDNTALHLAAESNHSSIVSILIKAKANLTGENNDSRTPIQLAVWKGHFDIVYELMRAGAAIGSSGNSSLSLLYLAAEAGHDSLVQKGLKMVVDENVRNRYMDATLRRAVQCGQINVVSSLLKNGANIEACDDDGLPPLFLAGEHPEVLSQLVHQGASINAKNVRKQNQSVLHHFAAHQHIDALLISLTCGCNINMTDKNDDTALHHVAKKGYIKIADILLKRGIDINAMNCSGETALHIAVENGHHDLAELLIESGVDIEAKTSKSQLTALHIALITRETKLIELLVERGADINATKSCRETALHLAAKYNLYEACSLLLERHANVNSIAAGQMTPLRHAIYNLNRDLVSLLIRYNASVHRICYVGDPIPYAISAANDRKGYAYNAGFIPLIKSLIEAGANTTGILVPENLKRRYPALEDILTNSSTLLHNTSENESLDDVDEHKGSCDIADFVLKQFRGNSNNEQIGRHANEMRLRNTRHKYGYGFPLSKRLQLKGLRDMGRRDGHANSERQTQSSQSFKLFNTKPLDERAIAIIQSLLDYFNVKLFVSKYFIMLEVDGVDYEMPPKWVSNFDKMKGIIREPGRLIVQITLGKALFSIPAWQKHEHPYLRFIDAVYVCRRLSTRLDQEAFSDVLGGSEKTLATDLHSILIAGLSILSIVGSNGLVDELVKAILDIKLGTDQSLSFDVISMEWLALNRRQCPCGHHDFHRPLSPVAAAKAVGIGIWRQRRKQIANRVWDLEEDELVEAIDDKKIDVRKVTFITHRWKKKELTYQDVMKKKRSNDQPISKMSEKLFRIRNALQTKKVRYVWIDTICIDSSNLSELDEAIRSMYKWYANCAAVVLDSETELKDWSTRGWCLQEGAAAGVLCGITRDGKDLATVQELAIEQQQDLCTLDLHLYYRPGNAAEIVARMDLRETTRDEDMAYALAGIFSIHLTLGYGEGFRSRERLFHELATKKGDLSFLSFQSNEVKSWNYLPYIGQANYLIATCAEASAPVMVSHFGICFDVQLVKLSEASQLLRKLNVWKDRNFADGRSLGVLELIQMAERPENQNSSSMKIAIVHYIRSILLVESYAEDFQTGGDGRPIKCCHRLQCCQIEESEFSRLFDEDGKKLERIWLRDMPDGIDTNITTVERFVPHENKRRRILQ